MGRVRPMITTDVMQQVAEASSNIVDLLTILHDMGYKDADVKVVEDGYTLIIAGATIASAYDVCAVVASEKLLDIVADKFHHKIPEA